jgi:hypothetical protein
VLAALKPVVPPVSETSPAPLPSARLNVAALD